MCPRLQPVTYRRWRLIYIAVVSLLVILSGTATPPCVHAAPASAVSSSSIINDDSDVRAALAAEARFDSKAALEAFLRADRVHPNDAFILEKISRQYSDLTIDTSDPAEKKQLCTNALTYALRAVEIRPDDPVAVLSLAVCYGKLGMYTNVRTRIEYSRLVLRHAEHALSLNPDYDYAHHVLGRWHYEVASLGAGTRFLVKLVYGGLPPASTAEGVRHLRRAVELSPSLPSHQIELGFALLADGQTQAARKTFEHALTLPVQEKHDTEARERARAALANLD
jgi:tetratricopeptide (TPR) repeat protein